MWLRKNYTTIIRLCYIIPILFAAGVSIAHVVTWYGLTNPITWAIYLSVGIEVAALSALAGITAKMNKWVYFPFIIVTLIQFIGNVFFSFQFIDIKNPIFLAWVDLVKPLFDYVGMANSGDLIAHKRWLAFFAGGMIPVISLSFLHLLIKFNDKESDKLENPKEPIEPEVSEAVRKSRKSIIPVGNIPKGEIDENIKELRNKSITPDLFFPEKKSELVEPEFAPEIEDVEFEDPENEPEVDADMGVSDLEFEADESMYALRDSTSKKKQLEAISDANSINPIPNPQKDPNALINDFRSQRRMQIERIGTNKIIKDGNPNQVFYKKNNE